MTPAKRRPATPATQGPARTAPDVPIVAKPSPVRAAKTKDDTQLLSPEGEPIGNAKGDSAPSETGQEGRATRQSPPRPLSLYPLPVWPD